MILDKLENAELYFGINNRIDKALHYIQNTDFTELETGRHDIEGDTLYANVFEYETKSATDSLLEAHRKYIDLQFVIEGEEQVGFATLKGQDIVKAYNELDDYLLIEEKYVRITLKKGLFAIFFPDDLHKPSLKIEKTSKVKKVVVKIKI
jgi:YhcH/YjgK/YiaL family protein